MSIYTQCAISKAENPLSKYRNGDQTGIGSSLELNRPQSDFESAELQFGFFWLNIIIRRQKLLQRVLKVTNGKQQILVM